VTDTGENVNFLAEVEHCIYFEKQISLRLRGTWCHPEFFI